MRTACSSKAWLTERMAKKDAAFEAYKALYVAGLVNNNLLPATQEAPDTELLLPTHTPTLVEVSPTLDPWVNLAKQQLVQPGVYHRAKLTIQAPSEETLHMLLLLPISLPTTSDITLHWNKAKHFTIASLCLPAVTLSEAEIVRMRSITYKILCSAFQGRMKVERHDFLWLLCPCDSQGHPLNGPQKPDWAVGSLSATDLLAKGCHDLSGWGLITQHGDLRKYIARSITVQEPRVNLAAQLLQVVRFPKRRDFLHLPVDNGVSSDAHLRIEELPVSDCMVDAMPVSYSVFALLFPSILYRIEIGIIAEIMRTTVLSPVEFEAVHIPLLVQALTSSATGEADNYQRLEFLGDCVLKYLATIYLMADNLRAPESYLTQRKGRLVSNGFLARAALAIGLDEFVITKRFTGAKWTPRYTEDLITDGARDTKVYRSSKLIADIIESLVGVSYVVGGFNKAFSCIQTLLPTENWNSPSSAVSHLYEATPVNTALASFSPVENLLGYTFRRSTLLLDALTHPSFKGPHVHSSYQRLEFLGDAVLDYVVSRRLFAHEPTLSHQTMHAIRTATVNASFLAFHMIETTAAEQMTDKTTKQLVFQHRALWQYLRSGDPELIRSRDIALQQHQHARDQIIAALNDDMRYPWHLFALTAAPKVLSDIVESVIGAVYIDSHGDIDACEVFIRRLGVIGRLERILHDNVDCLHPKERLGHLAVEKEVRYIRVKNGEESSGGDGRVYACQVQVGGNNVGDVVTGLNKLNAETIAAWKAIGILERQVQTEAGSEDEEIFDVEDGGGVMLGTM